MKAKENKEGSSEISKLIQVAKTVAWGIILFF